MHSTLEREKEEEERKNPHPPTTIREEVKALRSPFVGIFQFDFFPR